ncbi:protein HIRA/HIR1 [Nematocida sp. AWRm77]|nr:protein HIRA/HIR1 [Nematocida sp. AWRm77]
MKVFLPAAGDLLNKKGCTVFSTDFWPKNPAYIGTAEQDGTVRVWKVSEEETAEVGKYSKHAGSVLCLRFSPDGKSLATGSDDGKTVIWGIEEKEGVPHLYCRTILSDHRSDTSSISWSEQYLVTGGYDGSVLVYDTQTFRLAKRLEKHEKECKGVSFSPCGHYLATYGDEGELSLYGTNLAKISSTKKPFKGVQMESFFGRMSWSPDGKYLGCGLAFLDRRDTVAILTTDLSLEYTLIGHIAPVEVVAFNPKVWEKNGAKQYVVATGSQDRSVAIWSSGNSKPLMLLREVADQPILDLRWAPEGDALVGCSYDGSLFRIVFEKDELGVSSVPEIYKGRAVAYSQSMLKVQETETAFPHADASEHTDTEKKPEHEAENKESLEVPKKEKKKIIPRLVSALEMPSAGTAEGPRVVLFTPQKETARLVESTCPVEIQGECNGELCKIQVDRENSLVRVTCKGAEWFTISGINTKAVAAHKDTLVVVGCSYASEARGVESVWVYSLQKCVLLLPAMAFLQVMAVDVLDGHVLILLPKAFRVIDLATRAVIQDEITAHTGVVNVVLDRKYFLLALYQDGTTQFYSKRLRSWVLLELSAPSVFSDTFTEETETDATFEMLENKYLIGVEQEEWGLAEHSLSNIILCASRSRECPPGLLNRIEGVIEHFLSATNNQRAPQVQYMLSALRTINSTQMQQFVYYKLKDIEHRVKRTE